MRQQWRTALPGILGGLLDLAAVVHQRLETISVDVSPRMADFSRTLAAVDEILSTHGFRRYLSRASQLSEDSLSADPFIEQLRLHIREPLIGKSGGDLLATVTPTGDTWRRPKVASERPGCHSRPATARTCAPESGLGDRRRWRSKSSERAAVDHLSALQRCVGQTTLAILASLAHFGSA